MALYLVVIYDVTSLTGDEIDRLELEAVVQAERSDPDEESPGHPDVSVAATTLEIPGGGGQ